MSKLNQRQATFVREYLIDLNATQAAVRSGYSAHTAEAQASKLLRNINIAPAIQAALTKRAAKADITAERVLHEIARMAFYDAADLGVLVTDPDDGTTHPVRSPADIKLLPEDVRRAIVGWSWDKAGNFTIKLADKLTALDKLGRHLKLFTDKVELTGKDGEAIKVEAVQSAEMIEARLRAIAERSLPSPL